MWMNMWQLTKQSFHWLIDGRITLPWLILKEVQNHIWQNNDPRNLRLFLINSVWQNECICCLSHYTTDLRLKLLVSRNWEERRVAERSGRLVEDDLCSIIQRVFWLCFLQQPYHHHLLFFKCLLVETKGIFNRIEFIG